MHPNIPFDLGDQEKTAKLILQFLSDQSSISSRQFKTSRNLIIASILIMILQVAYAFWTNHETNSIQNKSNSIIEMQLKQSETISQMSLSLLDLENQVRNLETENELLKDKLK